MGSVFGAILIQAGYYAIVMGLVLGFAGLLQRGFFWKYLKVRMSFGRLVMVKLRSKLRDHFAYGWVEDDMLVFKLNKRKHHVALEDKDCFYRCLSVSWVDIDEAKKGVAKTDYSTVSGYDSAKFSDLLTRALMRPAIKSNQEKIILVMIIIVGVAALAGLYISYNDHQIIIALAKAKGIVIGGTGL